MRTPGVDRELLLVATLVILTGVALGMRAPMRMDTRGPSIMLSIPGRR